VAARFNAWVCGRSLAGIAGTNPAGGMNVSCEYCVYTVRGLCDGPIILPEESYRVLCLIECDLETSKMRRPRPSRAVEPWKILMSGCAQFYSLVYFMRASYQKAKLCPTDINRPTSPHSTSHVDTYKKTDLYTGNWLDWSLMQSKFGSSYNCSATTVSYIYCTSYAQGLLVFLWITFSQILKNGNDITLTESALFYYAMQKEKHLR
jgi:hypothetical protein